MAEETITQPVQTETEPSRSEERFKQLSDKVKEKSDALAVAESKMAAAEKKAAFAEGYADMVATYPVAKEFKADIEAKVMAGYTPEDATLAVLGKAGKLGNVVPQQNTMMPAGGSAPNAIQAGGVKPPGEMSQAERREQLSKDLIWS